MQGLQRQANGLPAVHDRLLDVGGEEGQPDEASEIGVADAGDVAPERRAAGRMDAGLRQLRMGPAQTRNKGAVDASTILMRAPFEPGTPAAMLQH